jgi:hypothetical protein
LRHVRIDRFASKFCVEFLHRIGKCNRTKELTKKTKQGDGMPN